MINCLMDAESQTVWQISIQQAVARLMRVMDKHYFKQPK
jgi:hypothetical protein